MLLLAAVLLAARLLPEATDHPVGWRDLTAQVGPLVVVGSERRLFRDRDQLVRYLRRARAARPAPAVDFSAHQLLLLSPGPRSSTGYAVQVVSVREEDGTITVRVRERAPGLRERVAARVTYPYRLVSLPAGKDVYVDWLGR